MTRCIDAFNVEKSDETSAEFVIAPICKIKRQSCRVHHGDRSLEKSVQSFEIALREAMSGDNLAPNTK